MQRFEARGRPRDEPQILVRDGPEVRVAKDLELLQAAEAHSGILQHPVVDLVRRHGQRRFRQVDGRQLQRLEAIFPEQVRPPLCVPVSQGDPGHGERPQVAAMREDLEDLCGRLSRVEAVEPEPADMLCQVRTLRDTACRLPDGVVWLSVHGLSGGRALERGQVAGFDPSTEHIGQYG